VSARDARGRETDGVFLPAGSHERPETRKQLLQADGVSVTIALTRQNSAKQYTGLFKEAAPRADESRKEFDSYFGFSGL
jgi:hypothetical protein